MCFSPHWGIGRGGRVSKGLVHNVLMQLFTLGKSKIKVFRTCILDVLST